MSRSILSGNALVFAFDFMSYAGIGIALCVEGRCCGFPGRGIVRRPSGPCVILVLRFQFRGGVSS